MENRVRSFVSIDFSENRDVVEELSRIQDEVMKWKFQGKITEPENLHLTLKFLGAIEKEKLEDVKNRLKRVDFSEMNLRLGKVGTFNFRGNPRIVWVEILGGSFHLHKKIDEVLRGLFDEEERFMSHLTIARVKYVKDKNGFIEYVSKIKSKKIKFSVDNFRLKKSELRKLGPVYETLEEFKAS